MRLIKDILKSPSLFTFGLFAGGNVAVAILGAFGGLLQARWVSPEVLGEYRKYGILTTYLNIGLIVVQDALMRQYPFLIGRGEKDEALKVAAAAKWWYMALSYLFSVLFMVLTGLSIFHGDFRASVGWGVQIVVVWSSFYGIYLGVMYRTSQDFKQLTYNNVLSATFGVILLVVVKVWGYWGVALRSGVQSLTSLWLNHTYAPVKVKSVFDSGRLFQLAKMSLPISVPGYVGTSLTSATMSFFIVTYFGQTELGIYGVALTLQGMAMIVTSAVGQLFYPKIMHKFGECSDFWSCIKYTIKPTCLNLLVSTMIVGLLCLVIGPFVRVVIPKYTDTIPIICILSINIILTAVELPFLVFVSALKYRVIITLSVIRFVACFFLIVLLPKTLAMIAWSGIFGQLLYVLVGYGLIVKMYTNTVRARLQNV
jgi:O-antigen/teichoic acid export membrane protein